LKLKAAARTIKARASDLAGNPAVAEIVAATLVAAAAALKDPKKARQIAEAAGDEITTVGNKAAGRGGAIWQLALDVARRSIALVGEKPKKAAKKAAKKPAKKKKK